MLPRASGVAGPLRLLSPLLAAASFRLRLPARCCSTLMAVTGPPPPAGAGAATAADSLEPAPLGWGPARSLSYYRLASQLAAIEDEPSRLGKESLMRELLCEGWAAGEERLVACAALTTLQLEAGAKPAKLGMGTAALLEAIAYATSAAGGPDTLDLEAGAGPAAAGPAAVGLPPAKKKSKAAGKVAAEGGGENALALARASRLRAELRVLGDIGLLASQELAALQQNVGQAVTPKNAGQLAPQEESGQAPGRDGYAQGGREGDAAAGWQASGGTDAGGAGGRDIGGGGGAGVEVLEVLAAMRALAAAGGDGAQERKPRMLAGLLGRMSPLEAKMVRCTAASPKAPAGTPHPTYQSQPPPPRFLSATALHRG